MFQGYVAAIRRGDKITLKMVLHNYKSISSHEGTCHCNISLKHVPATFSCVFMCAHVVILSLQNYIASVWLHYTSFLSLQHVPAAKPFVSVCHLKCEVFLMKMSFHSHVNSTNYHQKIFVLTLALKKWQT